VSGWSNFRKAEENDATPGGLMGFSSAFRKLLLQMNAQTRKLLLKMNAQTWKLLPQNNAQSLDLATLGSVSQCGNELWYAVTHKMKLVVWPQGSYWI